MVQAAQTTASTFEIWVLVVVSVGVLAFWLTAIFLADRSQVRASGQSRMMGEVGPAADIAWAGRGVAGEQASESPGEAVREPIGAQGRHAKDEPVPEGDIPTRADLPAQSGGRHAVPAQPTGPVAQPSGSAPPAGTAQPTGSAQPAERPSMPAQRTGDADRAKRSYTGPLPPDEDETGH